jgi:hypothetical protein
MLGKMMVSANELLQTPAQLHEDSEVNQTTAEDKPDHVCPTMSVFP